MLFLTLEGPEGAGKSTLGRELAQRLRERGYSVLETREPGGTAVGTRIREIVLLDLALEIDPLTEFLLYSASRAQLVREVIKPALASGTVVVCDRYADSSMAYQGYGRGLERRMLEDISYEATAGLRPHLTFLLDVDPAEGLRRASSKGGLDRLERADLGFHTRVRAGFLELAAFEPERFAVLDASEPAGLVLERAWVLLEGTLRFLGLGQG